MAYYTARYFYSTVRIRLEFSETDLRTVSGYNQFTVNSSQVELLLMVRTNILVKHHPDHADWSVMVLATLLSRVDSTLLLSTPEIILNCFINITLLISSVDSSLLLPSPEITLKLFH